MTVDEAKEILKEKLGDYLARKGIDITKPFRCFNSVAHKNNDQHPSMHYYGTNCHCFSCNANYDLLALIGKDYGLTDFKAQLLKAAELYGIGPIEFKNNGEKPPKDEAETKPKGKEIDFGQYELASLNPRAKAYLESRRIDGKTANGFGIRYSENIQGIEAIIIPTGKCSFNARNINPKCEKKDRYRKPKGEFEPFNIIALEKSEQPIFITEGEIDAISIIQAGGEAVALGGQGIETIFERAIEKGIKQTLIIALDNDDTGLKHTEELKAKKKELADKGLKLYFPDMAKVLGSYKDFNEVLVDNDFLLSGIVGDLTENAKNLEEIEKKEAEAKLKKDSVAAYKAEFERELEASKEASYIPTGFKGLDEKLLDGGLYSGLYVIGAISSLGKTTFCLQVGDQIAQEQKKDVLIFSLEMSKKELIAKSISRITSILDAERTQSNNNAKTTRGILTASRYKNYNAKELELINDSKELYFKDIAPNVYIYEGMGNIGVAHIRARVDAYKKITGKAPVVIIDYIQLLQPDAEGRFYTDKQITDYNVMELKRISRDFDIPIIGISSFNRDNYTAPVNMASFKESGAIEYSSDVLIGLQYKAFAELSGGSGQTAKESNKAKSAEIIADINQRARERSAIEVQLVILKNRNGSKGHIDLDFFPMFNKFKEPVNIDEWH